MEGYVRGNLCVWDQQFQCWRTPSGEDAHAVPLQCPHCEVVIQPDRPDACLGKLPFISGACCGHGRHTGYINIEPIPAPSGWAHNAYIALGDPQ